MVRVMISARRFLLHDEIRLFEMLSAVGLFIWAIRLPAVLPGAGILSQAVLTMAAAAQIMAMLARHLGIARRRFEAMAFAGGAWTSIAWVLLRPDLIAAAAACIFAGIYLGWKPTSCHS